MPDEELQEEVKRLTFEISKLESDYLIVKDQKESFDKRKEIRETLRELNAHLEKINKQLGD